MSSPTDRVENKGNEAATGKTDVLQVISAPQLLKPSQTPETNAQSAV